MRRLFGEIVLVVLNGRDDDVDIRELAHGGLWVVGNQGDFRADFSGLLADDRDGLGAARLREDDEQILLGDGGGAVVAHAENRAVQMRHVHAQNADDVARSAPARDEDARRLHNRVHQLVNLRLVDAHKLPLDGFHHLFRSFYKELHADRETGC